MRAVDPVAIVMTILALAVVAFMSNRVPLGIVALGVALALWATGVLSLNEALAGFGDPTVIFIAALFVVSEALDSTGVTSWAAQRVLSRSERPGPLLILVCLLVAVLTALISVNGAVAALIPMVVVVAVRIGVPLEIGQHPQTVGMRADIDSGNTGGITGHGTSFGSVAQTGGHAWREAKRRRLRSRGRANRA